MFKNPFGKKKTPTIVVTARLNAKVQPLDRGDIFEDPLDEILKERKLGEVCGGGTAISAIGEVEYCDIEVALFDRNSATEVAQILEFLAAPKGSKLQFGDGAASDLEFGRSEGLGLYLNGTDLADAVYAECDSNVVYDRISALIEGCGGILSHWQGPTETALYLYGDSFELMQSKIHDFVGTYPLCEKCRVVRIA